jgi:hypothetical protein
MTTLSRAAGFVSRVFADETVVVPVRAGVANLETIFTMNTVGSTIWQGIDGATTVDDLVRRVVREYSVGEAEAASDVAAFVALLTAKGLVVSDEPRG